MMRLLFYTAVFCGILVSCDQTQLYNNVEPIAGDTWHYDSAVVFEFEADDSINIHDMLLHIRNSKDYEYQNLWVFVHFLYPDGTEYTDTVECPLAYPDGKWVGSSGPGYINTMVMFKKNFQFPASGTYRISVVHGMRDDELEGIENIGLRVQRSL